MGPYRSWAGIAAVLVFAVVACAIGVSVLAHRPPAPLPENAPLGQFSAMRALKHLENYARGPHRAGTDANYRVRNYIVGTLSGMGAAPQITETTVVRGSKIANPRNVVARLQGGVHVPAFMLVAHYDSVPFGPGASDDGAGVAAMLETYRALKAGPALRNDVIFLFTDGEECGLLGAKDFLDNHPWAKDVGLMLNFEARGTRGPSYLFETSDENGWLVGEIAKAAPYPVTSSLMFDVYRSMPFSSDYRILKNTIPGMNIAFIDNLPFYHTAMDNPRNISRASLQHQGSYALAFARHFGNMPLDRVRKEPNAIYFNPIGTRLIVYPGGWMWPFVAMTAGVFMAVLILGFLRGRLSVMGVLRGVLAFLLTAVSVIVVLTLVMLIAFAIRGVYLLYHNALYAAAVTGLTVCVIALLHGRFRRNTCVDDLAVGAMVAWAVAMIIMPLISPGSSYFFTWPLFFSLLGIGISFLFPEERPAAPGRVAALVVFALPGILIIAPLIYAFFSAITALFGSAVMILAVLMYGLLIPLAEIVAVPNRRALPIVFGIAGLAFFAAGLTAGSPSERFPRFDCVSYALNGDTGQASWVSTDKKADAWTSQFFPAGTARGAIPEFGKGMYLKAAAPVAPLPPPEAELVNDAVESGARTASFHIISPRKAARMELRCNTSARSVAVNGIPLGKKDAPWNLDYSILSRRGFDLAIETDPAADIQLTLIDYTFALPDVLPGMAIRPRPPNIVVEPNTVNFDRDFQSDQAIVLKSFTFPGKK